MTTAGILDEGPTKKGSEFLIFCFCFHRYHCVHQPKSRIQGGKLQARYYQENVVEHFQELSPKDDSKEGKTKRNETKLRFHHETKGNREGRGENGPRIPRQGRPEGILQAKAKFTLFGGLPADSVTIVLL